MEQLISSDFCYCNKATVKTKVDVKHRPTSVEIKGDELESVKYNLIRTAEFSLVIS